MLHSAYGMHISATITFRQNMTKTRELENSTRRDERSTSRLQGKVIPDFLLNNVYFAYFACSLLLKSMGVDCSRQNPNIDQFRRDEHTTYPQNPSTIYCPHTDAAKNNTPHCNLKQLRTHRHWITHLYKHPKMWPYISCFFIKTIETRNYRFEFLQIFR